MTTQLNGETFATYATQEQHELVKWADDAHLASSHSLNAATALSEACALRYATLSYEAPHVAQMITERRERAIKELLKALEIIGLEIEIDNAARVQEHREYKPTGATLEIAPGDADHPPQESDWVYVGKL